MEKITRQKMYEYLISNAFEGGSNYWVVRVKITKMTEAMNGKYASEIATLPDGEIEIIEDGEAQNPHKLNHKICVKGFKIMKEKYPKHYSDAIKENDDATTGDVFLQCCLFGKLIYG